MPSAFDQEVGACLTSDDEDPFAVMMGEILAYLRAHPRARDTAQGIVQWWLPPSPVALRLSEVQKALDRLAAAGLIRAEPLPGGAVVYGGTEGT